MKKTILASSLSLVFLASPALQAAQTEAYYLVEEIPVEQINGLSHSAYDFNVTAISEDGSIVAGQAQTFRSPFRFYDASSRISFNYGCLYSNEVCDTFYYEKGGFYDLYRKSLRYQKSSQYVSNVQAFFQYATPNTSHSDGKNLEPVPMWDAVEDKIYVFDQSAADVYSTDTRINDINSGLGLITGYDSAPFSDDGGSLLREYVQRGFVQALDGSAPISLMPDSFDNDRGGISAGLHFIEQDGRQLVVGYSSSKSSESGLSFGFVNNSSDYFLDCQFGDDYEYARCSGFNTQAWIWDITNAVAGDEVEGEPLVDSFVRNRYSQAPKFNHIVDGNTENSVLVGHSSDDVYDNTTGSRGRAATFSRDEEGQYQVKLIPNIKETFPGDQDRFEDSITNTWATSINDQGLIVGNLRYNEVKGRNKPVEGFIYDMASESDTVIWPLRDKPYSGSNSEFSDINNNNQFVGWIDGNSEDQPAYNGTTRRQSGLLFDYDRYQNNESYYWELNKLTCFDNDGTPSIPLYRIEFANKILDDGTVLANGYHYQTKDDFIYGINPRPVLLRLVRNPAVEIDDLAVCPVLEEQPYERNGGSSAPWFVLMLLPLAFVRRCLNA